MKTKLVNFSIVEDNVYASFEYQKIPFMFHRNVNNNVWKFIKDANYLSLYKIVSIDKLYKSCLSELVNIRRFVG